MATGILGIERARTWAVGIIRTYFNAECVLVQVDAGDGLTLDVIDTARDVLEVATETWPFPGRVLIEVYGGSSNPVDDGAAFPDVPRLRLRNDIYVRVTVSARSGEAMEVIQRRSDRAAVAVQRLFLVKYRESLSLDGIEWVSMVGSDPRITEGDKLARQVTMRFEVITQEFLA